MDIKTFKDLYTFFQTYEGNFIEWFEDNWTGKEKQESAFRLFACLGLIPKLKDYTCCKGNFNGKTIQKISLKKDIFFEECGKLKQLNDKGDKSDLTCISKTNEKHIIPFSSKNKGKYGIMGLDISDLFHHLDQYKDDGFTVSYGIVVKSIPELKTKIKNSNKSSGKVRKILEQPDTIMIDWKDLETTFHQFKYVYGSISFKDLIKEKKDPIVLKLHQKLGVYKTMELISKGKKDILWGHVQRSGKSYLIAGTIIKHSFQKDKVSYLFITTKPNETLKQQKDVFECLQLDGFNIVTLTLTNTNPKLTNKNIIVCSTQYLKHDKRIKNPLGWLRVLNVDMVFIDECHAGGGTDLTKDTLDLYCKNSIKVYITATYTKPEIQFNIPKDQMILWDMEDIKMCKNIKDPVYKDRLIQKHGEMINEFLKEYSDDEIIQEYSKYPELWVLTEKIKKEVKKEVSEICKDNGMGWSLEASLLLVQTIAENGKKIIQEKFQNETTVMDILYRLKGKYGKFDIPDKNYQKPFSKRIDNIKSKTNSGNLGRSVELWFLPMENIKQTSNALKNLMEKMPEFKDYEIICLNSKEDEKNGKKKIEDTMLKTGKNIIALTYTQCSTGVSIENCDTVVLLNSSDNYDMIQQMMYRSMTPSEGKSIGFVIDLYPERQLNLITYQALKTRPDLSPSQAIKYILGEKLISLNNDVWDQCFSQLNNVNCYGKIFDDHYDNVCKTVLTTRKLLDLKLNRLYINVDNLSHQDNQVFKGIFSKKSVKEIKLNKGVEKIYLDNDEKEIGEKKEIDKEKEKEKENDKENCIKLFRHFITLICLLTINDDSSLIKDMIDINDQYLYKLYENQMETWINNIKNNSNIKRIVFLK